MKRASVPRGYSENANQPANPDQCPDRNALEEYCKIAPCNTSPTTGSHCRQMPVYGHLHCQAFGTEHDARRLDIDQPACLVGWQATNPRHHRTLQRVSLRAAPSPGMLASSPTHRPARAAIVLEGGVVDAGHDTSELEMAVLMTPDMANFRGKVHGGALLNLLDRVAFLRLTLFAGIRSDLVSRPGRLSPADPCRRARDLSRLDQSCRADVDGSRDPRRSRKHPHRRASAHEFLLFHHGCRGRRAASDRSATVQPRNRLPRQRACGWTQTVALPDL